MWSDQKVQPLDEVLGQYGGILQVNRVTVEHLIAERDEARAIARRVVKELRAAPRPSVTEGLRLALRQFDDLSWAKDTSS